MFKNTAKSQQTRERILSAASAVFQQKGFEKATLRDIAAADGMSLGAVYYYFKSKEELLLAFYEQVNEEVGEAYHRQTPEGSLAGRFQQLMQLKLQILAPHRRLLRIILKEAVDPESPLCPLSESSRPVLRTSLELFREVGGEAARGLWVGHMALLGLWLHDRTPDVRLTHKAISWVATLLTWSTRLAKIPGTSGIKKTLQTLMEELVGEEL